MSQIKISELNPSYNLNADPSQSLFITTDLGTIANGTFGISGRALGSSMYANNTLSVGTGATLLPNLVAQFTGINRSYVQVNEQNLNSNGTADYIVTADIGNDTNYYVDIGITNSAYSNTSPYNSLGTSIEPLSGYFYVQGNASTNNSGNLVIGTVQSNTETRFISGGINNNNVVVRIKSSGLYASNLYSNGIAVLTSEVVGPAAYNQANTSNAVAQAAFTRANTANITAQSAFNKANSAIANTNGVITAGDFNVAGNITVLGVGTSGLFKINATSYAANTPAFIISGSANNVSQLPLNQGYMMHITGFANTSTRVVVDGFGANAYAAFIGRCGRGTANTPSAIANNDILLRIAANGYANSFSQFGQARIDLVAAENFTDTTKGTQIQFWNTKIGTNTLVQIATFNGDKITFTGDVTPAKGFIYTPTVYPGAQTAITIDFANNSVVRAQTAAGLVVSLSNYTVGKVVELWVTNTAGGNQTFTHGVSALNSTTNATTYTIPGTSTILARYMCIDGTLANTLVSVIHA